MRTTPILRRSSLAAGALALAVAATAAGCDLGGPGGPMVTPTTGSITATGIWTLPIHTDCSDSSTWTYTAVTLTGTEGETGPIVHSHGGDPPWPSQGTTCRSGDRALNLRFGTWRVTWGEPYRSCVIDIRTTQWVIIGENGGCQTQF